VGRKGAEDIGRKVPDEQLSVELRGRGEKGAEKDERVTKKKVDKNYISKGR